MSPGAAPAVTVPARVTVEQLAAALGRDPAEVREALGAESRALLPGDYLDPTVATRVGSWFGVALTVEPRDLALELLYQVETGGEVPGPDQLEGRAGFLVRGVLESKEELDREIEEASEHWSVARMPILDRSILRLGLYELRVSPDTPTAVVVSEAIRLAHTYSTERSGSFVNGVLAALARRVRG